jgi:Family of unknown function (DUF6072)
MATATESVQGVKTGLQFVTEAISPIPGGSNLINGDFKQAGIHAGIGILAGVLFGLPGLLVVKANSFTKATTGRSLLEYLNVGDSGGAKK